VVLRINLSCRAAAYMPPIESRPRVSVLLAATRQTAVAIQLTGRGPGFDSATSRQASRERPTSVHLCLRRRIRCRISNYSSRSGSFIPAKNACATLADPNPRGTGPDVGGSIDAACSSDIDLAAGGHLSPRGTDRRTRHARSPSTPPRG
jgi:hypothetical protein